MKKHFSYVISLLLALCLATAVFTTLVTAAETNSDYTYQVGTNMQKCWGIDKISLNPDSNLEVVNAKTEEKGTFRFEMPRNGATVLIFFSDTCGTSKYLFQNLSYESWMDDERINVVAVESSSAQTTASDVQTFANTYASAYKDKINWCYDTTGLATVAYYLRYAGMSLNATWPVVTIVTEEEVTLEDGSKDLCRVVRFAERNFTRATSITNTLKYLYPDLNAYVSDSSHTHSFSEWKEYVTPTCTTGGQERRYCLCGEKEYRDTLPRHTEVVVKGKAATCTKTGTTDAIK